ncbi:hypothetical protein [Niabella hirudinis]|uniref:hypothetical protein n=1 Tax=Niabella hirudinis TaxID=1285929 RepID=UPI003EB89910
MGLSAAMQEASAAPAAAGYGPALHGLPLRARQPISYKQRLVINSPVAATVP